MWIGCDMKISIIWNDCPTEFGDKDIIAVFSSRTLATEFIRHAKNKDEYHWQYLMIKDENVRSTQLGLANALANKL